MRDFKRVNQFVFYNVPENAFIYKAIANRGAGIYPHHKTCRILSLYSKYDALKLERIIGTRRSQTLLSAEGTVHMFDKSE